MAITQELFDALLAWLAPDRDTAARKYEIIHSGLTRIFISRGFSDAEDLADLTISRVITLLPDIKDGYVGEPSRYFYGVARNIMHEAQRRPEIAYDVSPIDYAEESNTSDKYDYLLQCLELLPEDGRELILEYYLYNGRSKIEHHKRMAKERSITVGALRSRAHHIRDTLENCVQQRLMLFRRNKKDSEKHYYKER